MAVLLRFLFILQFKDKCDSLFLTLFEAGQKAVACFYSYNIIYLIFSFTCSLYCVCIVTVTGGPLTVNVSVLLLSLASPDESSLVSTNYSTL